MTPSPQAQADGPKLVCLGNLTLDDIVQPDGTSQDRCIGGDALYGVLAARLFLPRAEMVAPVGNDLPPLVRAVIGNAGLSQQGLPERPVPTLHTRFVYQTHDRREVSLLSDEGDFDTLSPFAADVPAGFWGAAGFMILAMTLNAQRDLVEGFRARSIGLIALDPQEEYIPGNEAAILDLVSRVDIFLPSLDEVRRLLGHEDALVAARHFARTGPRIVVIKMGAQGCLVHDAVAGKSFTMACYPAVPVDTTGGGDAFCSAFMASLVQAPADLERAAACGAVAAGFALAAYGADGLFSATPAQAHERLSSWAWQAHYL